MDHRPSITEMFTLSLVVSTMALVIQIGYRINDLPEKINKPATVQRWQEPYGGCEEAYRYPKSEGYAICKEHGLVP